MIEYVVAVFAWAVIYNTARKIKQEFRYQRAQRERLAEQAERTAQREAERARIESQRAQKEAQKAQEHAQRASERARKARQASDLARLELERVQCLADYYIDTLQTLDDQIEETERKVTFDRDHNNKGWEERDAQTLARLRENRARVFAKYNTMQTRAERLEAKII